MKKHLATLTLFALFAGLASADDTGKTHDHDHDHGHGAGHHPSILIPDSLPDLWAHINAYGKTVTDAAGTGDTAVLHKEQINLGALIDALGRFTEDLESGKRERVEGMIRNAQRAMGQLHEAADSEDSGAIQNTARSLAGVLAILKAQFPKDATSGTAAVQDDIGPHEGILAVFQNADGKPAGYLELKLHDDKGDLELWLAQDAAITKPFDLPADAKITVSFQGAQVDSATLAMRNADKNEDEDGNPNMRNRNTNYFIFPGDSGADSAWLKGSDFKARVAVSFESPAGEFKTGQFLLVPHTHHDH